MRCGWRSRTRPGRCRSCYASGLFRYGHEAVLIFFALSGFFIHLRAAESLPGQRPVALSLRGYVRRRGHRLAPTYYLALLVTLACDAIGRGQYGPLYAGATGDALLDGVFSSGGYAAAAVAPAALMLPSALGLSFGSNGPLWSLGYEVVYYASYPIWLAIRRRSGLAAFAGVPIACLALAQFAPPSFIVSALAWYPVWLSGAALVEWLARPVTPPRLISVICFGAGLAGYLASDATASRVMFAAIFAGAAVCAWLTVNVAGRAGACAEFLGRRSYSIYAMHFPILALLSALVFRASGARPMHGWIAVGGAIVTVAACVGLFELCERHFLHARLKLEAVRS